MWRRFEREVTIKKFVLSQITVRNYFRKNKNVMKGLDLKEICSSNDEEGSKVSSPRQIAKDDIEKRLRPRSSKIQKSPSQMTMTLNKSDQTIELS